MLKKNDHKNAQRAALFLLLLIQIGYALYYCSMKQTMCGDGFFTFNLGNNEGFGALGRIYGNAWTPQEYADNVLSISQGKFNFANVWAMQATDTHPPLYYALIHALCSVLQPAFTLQVGMWLGLWVNIAFGVGITWATYAVLKKMTNSMPIAYLGTLAVGISPAVMDMTTFVRMYNMAAFFVMMIVLWHIQNWEKQIGPKELILLALACVAAILTHYYTLPFIFCIALWFGVRLLYTHRYKDAAGYALATVGGAIIPIAIFPTMLKHIFSQGRGAQAFQNLADSSMITRLFGEQGTLKLINKFVLGNMGKFILAFICVAGVILLLTAHIGKRTYLWWDKPEIMLLATVGANFLLITKIAAYLQLRYFYFVCVPLLICIFTLLAKLAKKFAKKNVAELVATVAVFAFICTTAFSLAPQDYDYLYMDEAKNVEQIKTDGASTFVYLGDPAYSWKTMNAYRELEEADMIYFVDESLLDMLVANGVNTQPFYLFVENSDIVTGQALPALQALIPDYKMTQRFSVGYDTVYYCNKIDEQ